MFIKMIILKSFFILLKTFVFLGILKYGGYFLVWLKTRKLDQNYYNPPIFHQYENYESKFGGPENFPFNDEISYQQPVYNDLDPEVEGNTEYSNGYSNYEQNYIGYSADSDQFRYN